jgi:hypothetical protein
MRAHWSQRPWDGAIALWVVACVVGMAALAHYSMTPGLAGHPPQAWPADSRLVRPAGQYMFVLALHPHCPCSRATLEELDGIMAHCRGGMAARVLFVEPPGLTDSWVKTDLWRHALRIPGVSAVLDVQGVEAKRFGALTSGQSALYSPKGELVFQGGITGARGHAGDNAGFDAVLAHVSGTAVGPASTPVFGCPLEHPDHGSKETQCPSR